MRLPTAAVACTLALAAVAPVDAQWPPLTLPQPSPLASISQTVGVTKISVDYSRPRVQDRKVWDGLVPYGQVWRAGANVNTVVTFSTPVAIAGQPLAAGSYGLHMIPTAGDWTVIFSRDHERWGSFGYTEANDALRVTLRPGPGPRTESLSYTFDALTGDSAELVLQWELLRLAIPIAVDTKSETVAALRSDLTGLAQFFWQPWNTAANYCLTNDVNLEEAAQWIERSIQINRNFANQKTKSKLLRRTDAAAADALLTQALAAATEAEVNQHGYELLGEGKSDEAIAIFRRNVKDHPESWNVHDSLAEALAAAGKNAEAIAFYRKALGMAPPNQKARIEAVLEQLAKR